MSVVPDRLLQLSAEVKPRAAQQKAPADVREPRKNEPSSFAHVYAQERQNKAAERHDSTVKATRHKAERAPAEAVERAPAADAETQVADSGKPLPNDPAKPQVDSEDSDTSVVTAEQAATAAPADPAPLDPLLLMSMAMQLPAVQPETLSDADATVAETTEEVDPQALLTAMTPAALGLPSAAPAAMTSASHDPTLDELNTLPGVRMALELGAQAQVAAQQGGKDASKNAASGGALGMTNNLEELMPQVMPGGELTVKEGDFAKLVAGALPGIDESKSASPEARAENLTERLSALSQAINQQGVASGRLSTVPGQPLAMHQSGWTEAVVDKVMWLSSQNLKSADIQLDPLELGRLEVRVHMAQDQTQVTFASPNAGVRDALESQVHRLRDLFSQQGMNLLDVNVSDQSMNRGWQGQGQEGDGQRRGGTATSAQISNEDELLRPLGEVRTGTISGARSLVDYYA